MINLSKIIATTEARYISKNLRRGKRIDGRDLFQYRDINVEVNLVKAAEGSASVSLGDSKVITGIKYELGPPFPDMPDKGVYTVMAELIPIASPLYESGPPDEEAVELARLVDRPIRSAETINNDILCIIPEKLVYVIFIDVYVMNFSGNLIDCSAISALASLISSKIPKARIIDEEKAKVEWSGEFYNTKELVKNLPISVTFGKLDDIVFLDPNLMEELVMDGRITFAFNDDGNLVSIQKGLDATFSNEEIKTLAKKAKDLSNDMRRDLNLWQYQNI
jgi:exosome complex component RRP42